MSVQEPSKCKMTLLEWETINKLDSIQNTWIDDLIPTINLQESQESLLDIQIQNTSQQNQAKDYQKEMHYQQILDKQEQNEMDYLQDKLNKQLSLITYYKQIKEENNKFMTEFHQLKTIKEQIHSSITSVQDTPKRLLSESKQLTSLQEKISEVRTLLDTDQMISLTDSMDTKAPQQLQRFLGEIIERIQYLESHSEYPNSHQTLLILYELKDSLVANCKSLLFRLIAKEERYVYNTLSSLQFSIKLSSLSNTNSDQRLSDYLMIQTLNDRSNKHTFMAGLFPEFGTLFPVTIADKYDIQYNRQLTSLVKFLYDQCRYSHDMSLLLKSSVEEYYSVYRQDVHKILITSLWKQMNELSTTESRHIAYIIVEVLYYEDLHYSCLIHRDNRKYVSIVQCHLQNISTLYLPLLQHLISISHDLECLCLFQSFLQNIANNLSQLITDFRLQQRTDSILYNILIDREESVLGQIINNMVQQSGFGQKIYFLCKKSMHLCLAKRVYNWRECPMMTLANCLRTVNTRLPVDLINRMTEELLGQVISAQALVSLNMSLTQWVMTLVGYQELIQVLNMIDSQAMLLLSQPQIHNIFGQSQQQQQQQQQDNQIDLVELADILLSQHKVRYTLYLESVLQRHINSLPIDSRISRIHVYIDSIRESDGRVLFDDYDGLTVMYNQGREGLRVMKAEIEKVLADYTEYVRQEQLTRLVWQAVAMLETAFRQFHIECTTYFTEQQYVRLALPSLEHINIL